MRRPLRRGGLLALTRAAPWLAAIFAACLAAATGAGVPAPGGEPLLAAAETATATALGTVLEPGQVDLHGWTARLRVERVLSGELAPDSVVRIAWEELSRGRPARFRDGDRILVALHPLPGASLWSQRFPDRDALAVAARGEAFLRAPDLVSVETLGAFLALPAEQRQQTPGVEALTGLVSRAQPPLARAALARLAEVPGLDPRISYAARGQLARAAADPGRPKEVRQGVLRLIGERQLRSLRPAVELQAREGSPLRAEALGALAALDGGLPADRVALLLESDDPAVRAVAVRNTPGTPSERRLARLLREDPDPRVRAAAVETLLAAQGEAGVGSAGAALFDDDAHVREVAVRGLASLGAAAVPTLENLVEHRTVEEAKAPLAALALAGPSGRAALERIAALHPDEQVRALARLMLGRRARPPH
jgi:hypothetical protein